jgi:hypothetical protein
MHLTKRAVMLNEVKHLSVAAAILDEMFHFVQHDNDHR